MKKNCVLQNNRKLFFNTSNTYCSKTINKLELNSIKSQSSFEFITLLSIVLVFLIIIVASIINRTNDYQLVATERSASSIFKSLDKEISMARQLQSGYSKNFYLPTNIEGDSINITLIKGKEVVIKTDTGYEYLSFLPQFVYGEIGSGNNKVLKQGTYIGFCNEKKDNYCSSAYNSDNSTNRLCYCYGKFPINTSGKISCSKKKNIWEECNFVYGDKYIGIRAECPGTTDNVTLSIKNIDDNKLLFRNYSSLNSFGQSNIIEFMGDFNINESGDLNFNYTCARSGTGGIYSESSVTYFVPFGYYLISKNDPSSLYCSRKSTDNYTCQENKNLTLSYTIECIGGECGNTTIWLDP